MDFNEAQPDRDEISPYYFELIEQTRQLRAALSAARAGGDIE